MAIEEIQGQTTNLTLSIGVATAEGEEFRQQELLKESENQLYRSKRLGKNTVCGECL